MMIFPQASRLRDKLFPVDGRGNAVAGLENPGKMILVRKIEKRGNLGDRQGGIRQKIFRETDSLFDQVIIGGLPGFGLEKMDDMADGNPQRL